METEAAARSPTRKQVHRRTCEYVEERDADTHCVGTRKVYA
jgi:hypothetical protein